MSSRKILNTTWNLNKIAWKNYTLIMSGVFLVGIFEAVHPIILSAIQAVLINKVVLFLGGGDIVSQKIYNLGVIYVLILILPTFLNSLSVYLEKINWFKLNEYFELKIISKRADIDIAVHESSEYRNLENKVKEKGAYVLAQLIFRTNDVFKWFIQVVAASIAIFVFSWKIFIFVAIASIPYLIVSLKTSKDTWFIWGIDELAMDRRKFWKYQEYFMNIRTIVEIKLLNLKDKLIKIISGLLKVFDNKHKKVIRERLAGEILSQLFSQGSLVVAFFVFFGRVLDGNLEIGTFIFILTSIQILQSSLINFFQSLSTVYENALYSGDYLSVLEMKPLLERSKNPKDLPLETPGIEFKNISFKYPKTENYIFKNFSLKIPAGQKLAIIGVNGAGKTTLVKLLCRFYDPSEGDILIDGINLKNISLDSWYSKLGILFQEYGKYELHLDEMVSLGNANEPLNEENVKESLKKADAESFVQNWGNKYKQQIGVELDGIEPSVGQWQKLALARVFYRDPQIWILDEPTASIDAEAESNIFNTLEKLPNNRTVVLISHRFSTVRNADIICVISEGEMIEHGTHEELIKKDGEYSRLFKLQAKGYK